MVAPVLGEMRKPLLNQVSNLRPVGLIYALQESELGLAVVLGSTARRLVPK